MAHEFGFVSGKPSPPKPKPKKPKYSEAELFRMSRRQQVKLLRSLGAKKIPNLEKNRVKLIMELAS